MAVYVCNCYGVTEQAIKAAVANGARTISDLVRTCSAGGECGACHSELAQLLESVEQNPTPNLVSATPGN
jgi:bacterioferritin-associated ferredoxin